MAADNFLITSRTPIIERLIMMQERGVLLNVSPDGGRGYLTSINKVLPTKDLFAIDQSDEEELNEALKKCRKVEFSASLDGVPIRFETTGVTPATLSGHLVFAVTVPKSIFWRQRRHAIRYQVPAKKPIDCNILLPGMHLMKFPVLDMSETGLAVLDENQVVASTLKLGHIFQSCQFTTPTSIAREAFSAELCRTEVVGSNGVYRSYKLGLRYDKLPPGLEKNLAAFLHEMAQEARKKKQEDKAAGKGGILSGIFGRK